MDPQQEFGLFRDKVLLGLGSVVLAGIAIASIFGNIRNQEVALAALAVAATLLGAPTVLRWDESSARRKSRDEVT
jgi:hypothetical protein